LTAPVEYPYYSSPSNTTWQYIPWSTAKILISKCYYTKGMSGFYNWQAFLVPYYT